MPKLDSRTAGAVDETEAMHGGDFEPLEPGKYLGRLVEVKIRDEKNKYGAVQWSAEFESLRPLDDPDRVVPGRQWLNLTLPSSAKPPLNYTNGADKWEKYQNLLRGRLKAFFESFGYTSDSDTEEMHGEWAVITVSVRTAQSGKKQGQQVNQVDDIEAVPEDIEVPEVESDDVAF